MHMMLIVMLYDVNVTSIIMKYMIIWWLLCIVDVLINSLEGGNICMLICIIVWLLDSNSEGGITILCKFTFFMVRRGAISIVNIVALICIDMHQYFMSLKKTCSLVQNGGLVACPKLRRESHGFRRGTRFLREPNF